jgi:hypothetical protein
LIRDGWKDEDIFEVQHQQYPEGSREQNEKVIKTSIRI